MAEFCSLLKLLGELRLSNRDDHMRWDLRKLDVFYFNLLLRKVCGSSTLSKRVCEAWWKVKMYGLIWFNAANRLQEKRYTFWILRFSCA